MRTSGAVTGRKRALESGRELAIRLLTEWSLTRPCIHRMSIFDSHAMIL
jgi:hypothetical protein